MLETLSILPRSRRADVHRNHRPTPVLLPKRALQQTTLDQWQQRLQAPNVPNAPAPNTPSGPNAPPKHQNEQTRPLEPNAPAPNRPFSIAGNTVPTRSIHDLINHADSMRPKRKSGDAIDAHAQTHTESQTKQPALLPDGPTRKRPRLAVELFAKSPSSPVSPPMVQGRGAVVAGAATRGNSTGAVAASAVGTATAHAPPKQSGGTATASASASAAAIASARATATATATATSSDSTSSPTPSPITSSHPAPLPLRPGSRPPAKNTNQLAAKLKDKAIIGFKQELKSLRVTPAEAIAVASGPTDGGRKLRSQEATRFKSDLSQYFPEYDEVIGNDPKEEHILEIDTPIILVESSAAHPATDAGRLVDPLCSNSTRYPTRQLASAVPVRGYGDRLFYDVSDSHVLDFTFLAAQHKGGKSAVDPLPDSYFELHHKRAERLERSIRNTEKGRAQHEKDQILRLLEGLQGPDWLRIMGVSGITETKKKAFEPAREHFIRGCRSILEKFRLWSLEEKRRKTEKDRAHAEELRAREEATGQVAAPGRRGRGGRAKGTTRTMAAAAAAEKPKPRRRKNQAAETTKLQQQHADDDDDDDDDCDDAGDENEEADEDDDSVPESSDFDAVITRQLQEEALARSRLTGSSDKSDAVDEGSLPQVRSFFQKPYQREAALSKDRRKGRTVMAWGQPIPEPKEVEFDLPEEILEKEDEEEGENDNESMEESMDVNTFARGRRGRGGVRAGGRGGRGSTRGARGRGGARGGARVGTCGGTRGGGRGGRPRKTE